MVDEDSESDCIMAAMGIKNLTDSDGAGKSTDWVMLSSGDSTGQLPGRLIGIENLVEGLVEGDGAVKITDWVMLGSGDSTGQLPGMLVRCAVVGGITCELLTRLISSAAQEQPAAKFVQF